MVRDISLDTWNLAHWKEWRGTGRLRTQSLALSLAGFRKSWWVPSISLARGYCLHWMCLEQDNLLKYTEIIVSKGPVACWDALRWVLSVDKITGGSLVGKTKQKDWIFRAASVDWSLQLRTCIQLFFPGFLLWSLQPRKNSWTFR